jgi:peptidoglycan/xylan/chitin deacetylase (PgdA/CDA1 family)
VNAEAILDRVLASRPITAVTRRSADLVVLAYHGVDDRAQFGRHLDHLVDEYHPIDLDTALAGLDGAALPRGAALITFDDGERSVYTDGLPELERRGLPAVLFDVAGVLNSSLPFWWVEAAALLEAGQTSEHIPGRVRTEGSGAVVRYLKTVSDVRMDQILADLRRGADPVTTEQLTERELADIDRRGVRVENHSWLHPLLDMCSAARIENEIDMAHARLTDVLGRAPTVFAYPNGNVDDRVTAALAQRNYSAGFLFDHSTVGLPVADRLRLGRVRVNSTTSDDRFAAIVAGAHPLVHRLRGGA